MIQKAPCRPGRKLIVTLRLTQGEREELNRCAAEAGCSVNEYLRRKLGIPEPSTEANPYLTRTPAVSLNAGRD